MGQMESIPNKRKPRMIVLGTFNSVEATSPNAYAFVFSKRLLRLVMSALNPFFLISD